MSEVVVEPATPASSPTLAAAKSAKATLEKTLLAAITAFESTTGLTVERVELDRYGRCMVPGPLTLGAVRVEVSL